MFTDILNKEVERICSKLGKETKLASLFANCYPNTLETTTKALGDGKFFVFTGDIPAMWLRDSSAQVRHYLSLAKREKAIADVIEGLSRRQAECILQDPYANAFNETPNGRCYRHDDTAMILLDWERKYEIDSLCYPVQLAYLFWKETGRAGHLNENFHRALQTILTVWEREQHHDTSDYYFRRTDCPSTDTLPCDGHGNPVGYTGMTWSGFRPSDDACVYGYLIPSNMFAVVALGYAAEILRSIYDDAVLADKCDAIRKQIDEGIQKFGIVDHPVYGKVYAYETDGLGHYLFMDDANVPSLLSIPYLGYCSVDDPIYLNTRKMILSKENPYYFEGKVLKGIGSPHTPSDYIWHIALSMQGLTAPNMEEKKQLLDLLASSDGGTGFMHEGVHVDDPSVFTRSWFAWSNSIFSEFVLDFLGEQN